MGELQVTRAGAPVVLPASKRTRALLGYVAALGVSQLRQTLCDLLWEGPDDPRAALRWSLTKLRPLINDVDSVRLAADREHVAFAARGAFVDVDRVAVLLAGGIVRADNAALEEVALLLSGEFLEGLELPSCYRFHHWCMAERERLGAIRCEVLAALVIRLRDQPARALAHARTLVSVDPLSEQAHAMLLGLLVRVGRRHEAQTHYEQASAMLRRELAASLSGEMDRALRQSHERRPLLSRPENRDDEGRQQVELAAPALAETLPILAGRMAEREAIAEAIEATRAGERQQRLLLFTGDPGIGKTRLLHDLAMRARASGGVALLTRCFEAEAVRPYGCWIDALRDVAAHQVPEALRHELAPITAFSNPAATEGGDRARLTAGVTRLLRDWAREQPISIILDDLQWIDEASAALLHYLIRTTNPGTHVLFAGAVRPGEIDDNPWAKRMMRSLAQDRGIDELPLQPLDQADIAALVGAGSADAIRLSGGNPLFALELARAAAHGPVERGRTIAMLVGDRLDRLDTDLRDLVAWAAAIGRSFRPELLGAVAGVAEPRLPDLLERLERRGVLRADSDGQFDFVHDLVRDATYRALPQARRRMTHRHIFGVLSGLAGADARLHGEVARHASLAGDHAAAARACVLAGDHCLRLYAMAEAMSAAARGLAEVAKLATPAERIGLTVALMGIKVRATTRGDRDASGDLAKRLEELAESAELLGLHDDAASALHLLSWLNQQTNDILRTHEVTLRAERASRSSDAAIRCQQLANTGRCLLEVEADVPRAFALVAKAAALAQDLDMHFVELEWGQALVARWRGDLGTASDLMHRALRLAQLREDHWRETECLVWLAMLDLERNKPLEAIAHCDEVARVSARMSPEPHAVAGALRALAGCLTRKCNAMTALRSDLAGVRKVDDKAHLAYLANSLAALALDQGHRASAQTAAEEALAAARAVRRPTEIVVATALLACITGMADPPERSHEPADFLEPGALSARAKAFAARARALPFRIATLAPTTNGQSSSQIIRRGKPCRQSS